MILTSSTHGLGSLKPYPKLPKYVTNPESARLPPQHTCPHCGLLGRWFGGCYCVSPACQDAKALRQNKKRVSYDGLYARRAAHSKEAKHAHRCKVCGRGYSKSYQGTCSMTCMQNLTNRKIETK